MVSTNVTGSDERLTTWGDMTRQERLLLMAELGALIALTIADAWGLVPLSRTPFLLLLCWASLRLRRLPWRTIGFTRPPRLGRAIAIGVVAGVAIELFAINGTTPWIASVTGTPPDVSDLDGVVGNWQALLIMLGVSWILAAFGEELAFRGYLMNRDSRCIRSHARRVDRQPRRGERVLRHRARYSGHCRHRAGIIVRLLAGNFVSRERQKPDRANNRPWRLEQPRAGPDLPESLSWVVVSSCEGCSEYRWRSLSQIVERITIANRTS